jgi:hypothetical protein
MVRLSYHYPMGLSHHAAAALAARLTLIVNDDAPPPPKPGRGHARSAYVDRSRTDSLELRGFPLVGRGIPGVIRGTAPGDSVAALGREARDLNDAGGEAVRRRMRHARARHASRCARQQ